ncbi:ligand-binding sensor domain-containing protein [Edaphobacter flagellatus]|uniref:ligand-binding sensor domain-containing protein n=1 Tax=Edaphobacter flagellatus TaxID=1933044 RepID=UPI0021B19FCC|nr:sensor histidine kinase [Edaphobacter flagellatus]
MLAISLVLTVLGSASVRATDQIQSVWQTKDGLPETNIQALAQTPDHYLWVGTTGGLLRFDGNEFTLFNHENTPELPIDDIASLLVTRTGTLWIGTAGGGLVRHDKNGFRKFVSAKQGGGFVRAMLEDKEGRLWIGALDGLFLIDGVNMVRVDDRKVVHRLQVFSMTIDRSGTIWIGGPSLYSVRGGKLTEYPFHDSKAQTAIEAILATDDGQLWIGTYSGLFRAPIKEQSPGTFTRVSDVEGAIHNLKAMSQDSVWIGTVSRGIYTYTHGVLKHLTTPSPLPSNEIFAILQDVENNIWIGTLAGLVRLSHSGLSVVPLSDASNSDVQAVYADPQGPVWVASTHLFRLSGGVMKRVEIPALAKVHVQTVLMDRAQTLWFGTQGNGVFHQSQGAVTQYAQREGLENGFVRALIQTRDGDLWVGTPGGLYRQNGHERFQRIRGWPESSIRVLLEDHAGTLWAGTEQGVYAWRQGVLQDSPVTRALQHIPVWSMCESSDGTLWLGTVGHGLYRWDANDQHMTILSTANGLPSDKIFGVLEDASHRIWLSSPNGISVIAASDVKNMDAASRGRLPLTFYRVSEGTLSTQLLGGIQPSGTITRNGDIWFPSIVGPLKISPAFTSKSSTVPIVLKQIIADGRSLPVKDPMKLAASVSQLEIHYGAIKLKSQSELRFRYFLENFDKRWNDAGSRREAYYTNLPPGRYTLHVVASDLSAPEITSEFTLSIVKQAHFYQSLWFYTACALVTIGLILLSHWLHRRRIEREFQAVLRERSRIAWEMHDTFLQGCASVSSLLEGISMTNALSSGPERTLLDSARSLVSATIDDARKVVWDLRQHTLGHGDITQLTGDLVAQTQERDGIRIEYVIKGQRVLLPQATAYQIVMVVREALLNAVRHANPSKVRLSIAFTKSDIEIEIVDDGKGFDMNAPREGSHFGISVMRERIQHLDGKLHVESAIGQGARITIFIPLGDIPTKAIHHD